MPPKKKKHKLDWGHKQLKRLIRYHEKNMTPEVWALESATTEILKLRGYAVKPSEIKKKQPDLFVVMSIQLPVQIVIRVMKRQGWTHPKQKRRKK